MFDIIAYHDSVIIRIDGNNYMEWDIADFDAIYGSEFPNWQELGGAEYEDFVKFVVSDFFD